MNPQSSHAAAPTASHRSPSVLPPRPPLQSLSSSELLHGAREVLIRHGEQVYRLRHTRQGKLILTK